MKIYIRISAYLSLFILALNFISCQQESDDFVPDENSTAIMANSTTAVLMQNTAFRDGSFDNIVDGASCFDIKFPYTVSVNGLELTINSLEDLQLIEQIFDAIDDDENLLEIIFPITITKADYTEVTLNNLTDLRALAQECKEGGGDDDIECIDFVYPINFFTFNINLEQTGNVVIESDKDLRAFFNGLEDTDLVSIDFPISLKLYDGTIIQVNSNEELVRTIEGAKDACDEDDDDDYNDDDFSKERLDDYLVECPWLIREVKRSEQDQTEQYFEYAMNFSSDGEVAVKDREGNSITGTWSTRISENGVLLKLDFEALVDFNLEWLIYEIGEGKIKLYESPGNRIIMYNACDVYNDSPDSLRELLKQCSWIIKGVKNNGEQINRLLGYEFEFMAYGVVTLSNEETVSEGTWEVTTNQEGRLVLAIVMGNENGVSFEWLLSDLKDRYLKFNIEGTYYELLLVRNCQEDDSQDTDVALVKNILSNTEWSIGFAEENGDDTTAMYTDVTLYTDIYGAVEIRSLNGEVFSTGRWFVYRNAAYQLELILSFSPGSNYLPLANDYLMIEIEQNRLELKHQNDGEGYDKLILEKY